MRRRRVHCWRSAPTRADTDHPSPIAGWCRRSEWAGGTRSRRRGPSWRSSERPRAGPAACCGTSARRCAKSALPPLPGVPTLPTLVSRHRPRHYAAPPSSAPAPDTCRRSRGPAPVAATQPGAGACRHPLVRKMARGGQGRPGSHSRTGVIGRIHQRRCFRPPSMPPAKQLRPG